MPRAGKEWQAIIANDETPNDVVRRLVSSVTNTAEYSVLFVGPSRLSARRGYTPRWAVVWAVLLALPTGGTSLALFLVKRQEDIIFTVAEKEGTAGAVTAITGVATAQLIERVTSALGTEHVDRSLLEISADSS